MWLPVDPTLNQFPADATHLRLVRGGLDRQAAILPLIGRLKMTVLDLELAPGTDRVIVGRQAEIVAPAADALAIEPRAPPTVADASDRSRSTQPEPNDCRSRSCEGVRSLQGR